MLETVVEHEVSHGDFFETGCVRRAVVVPHVALCRWLQAGNYPESSTTNRRARVANAYAATYRNHLDVADSDAAVGQDA
jgi:hypothetical protein